LIDSLNHLASGLVAMATVQKVIVDNIIPLIIAAIGTAIAAAI
jgi:hypothetical protein